MAWVLYLGNHWQGLYRSGLRGTRLVWEGEAPPAVRPDAWHPVRRLKVLVDLIEEEFRLEHLPHLTGPDHRALVARKRRQLFQDAALVTVEKVGRETHGRRDDRILFSAIRASMLLESWRQVLMDWQIRLTGFWSLPRWVESGLLPVWHDGLRVLAYSQGKRVALRQNYCHGGRLLFSRISLLNPDDLIGEAPEEIERTWRYLQRTFGALTTAERRIQVVAPQGWASDLTAAVAELPETRVETGALQNPDVLSRSAARLGRCFWSRPHYRALSRPQARLPQLLYGTALAAVAGVGLYASYVWERHEQLARERARLRHELSQLAQTLADLPQPGDIAGFTPWQIAAWQEAEQTLAQVRLDPAALLNPLSQVLDRFPAWELVALAWQRVRTETGGEEAEDWPQGSERPLEVVLVLRHEAGTDLRVLAARWQRLRAAFQALPQISRAELLESSIPLTEGTPLAGQIGSRENVGISATFKLKLSYRSADEEET